MTLNKPQAAKHVGYARVIFKIVDSEEAAIKAAGMASQRILKAIRRQAGVTS